MNKPLRLLIVEDSEDDAQLVLRELKRVEYEVTYERVDTEQAMQSALERMKWDIILCDYSMPKFSALKALELLRAGGYDVPLIVVSGTISEETAVTALKSGANDFLLKGSLSRLGPAVERELREVATRRARHEAESRYKILVEQLPVIVYINPLDQIENTSYISPQVQTVLGYSPEEWLADPKFWQKVVHPDDLPQVIQQVEHCNRTGEPFNMEYRMLARDGHIVWIQDQTSLVKDAAGNPLFWQGLKIDITDRRQAEQTLRQQEQDLQKSNAELTRLYRSSEALLNETLMDVPSLARTIVHTILQEFEQSNCSLLLLNRETRRLERLAIEGPYTEKVTRTTLSLDKTGLVAKSIRTKQVVNVPDVLNDPDYLPSWDAARSELVIPLKIGNEVIGALDMQSPRPYAFQSDDERLMTIFAERTALALERTRLYEQTRQQLDRLESLRTIDLAISNSFDLRISLNIVLEQAINRLGVDAAAVLVLKPETGRLEFAAGRGFRTRGIEATSLRMGEGLPGRAVHERQIVQRDDLDAAGEQFARRELLADENFVAYFGVPLVAKGEIKGVLEVFHRSPLKTDMEWLDFLDALGWQAAIAVDNALMFQTIRRSNTDLAMAYEATIEGWSRALDLRDRETEGHTRRVTEMTLKLAEAMRIGGDRLIHIQRGALLHDIGKMGVPDNILLKPGPLTEDEWTIMRQHPKFALDLLSQIAYLKSALDIPYCHHERWDGSGYPRGLSGTEIPMEARLFAVVDVWDALTSDRPYRKRWAKKKALTYIREQSGRHFEPQVVEIFLREIVK